MSVTPSAPRRGLSGQLVVGVLGALVGLVFAVLLYRAAGPSDPSVAAQLRTYVVESDSAVAVELDVARPPGTEVECLVRASGSDGEEVGRTEAPIPVSDRRSTIERVVVQTSSRAGGAELVGCRQRDDGDSPAP